MCRIRESTLQTRKRKPRRLPNAYVCVIQYSVHDYDSSSGRTLALGGERGGLVEVSLTTEREVGGSIPTSPSCVLEQRRISSPKSTGDTP